MLIVPPYILSEDLLRRADEWAAQHNIPRERVLEIALENLFATAVAPIQKTQEDEKLDAEDARYLRAMRPKRLRAMQIAEADEKAGAY